MKKLFCILICLVVGTLSLHAQGKLGKVGTSLKNGAETISRKGASSGVLRNGGKMATRGAAGKVASNAVKTSTKLNQAGKQSSVSMPSREVRNRPTQINSKDLQRSPNTTPNLEEQSQLRAAQQKTAEIERRVATLKAAVQAAEATNVDLKFNADFGKSVLFIPNLAVQADPSLADQVVNGYSTTIIKSNYHGQEEIFGVIPTHSLPPNWLEAGAKNGVMKEFNAQFTSADGTIIDIPGKVVQVSPESMLDISLVKFDSRYESLLKPLELADEATVPNELILSPGFANGNAKLIERVVTQNSFISVRTNLIDVGSGARAGFCGSPLLDAQGRVKAIHTGSVEEKGASYGTHVAFVKKLIEAYHNNGKATYDLILDDHVLTTLNIDEYISGYAVVDGNFNVLFKDDGIGTKFEEQWKKYSENKIRNTIKEYGPDAQYLVLHSRTPIWNTEKGISYLEEDRTLGSYEESKLRIHVYDLKDREFLWTTETEDIGANYYFDLDGMTVEHGKVVTGKKE